MLTTKFWKDVLERVIRTAAQAFVGAVATTAIVQDVDWAVVGGTTFLAALLSLATAIAAGASGDLETASFQKTDA